MPFIDTIIDLSTIPPFRAGPVNDENSSRLLEGLVLEQTEGIDFAVGRAARRREMFRGRARTRGLRQVTHRQLDEQGRVILLMRWQRESVMPARRAEPVNDELSSRLLKGLLLEQTEGVDFAVGRVDQRREMFRGRARTRGLRQVTHRQLDEQGRVILFMRWYRERYGDLSVTTPPKRRAAMQRS